MRSIIAGEGASFGYPPSRVWGTPTTAMWVYRMGLERAKRYLLTGDEIPAPEAARIGLVLETVPDGVTELGCHPGEWDADFDSMYRDERPLELAALCDPRVRDALRVSGIRLCSFYDLPPRPYHGDSAGD